MNVYVLNCSESNCVIHHHESNNPALINCSLRSLKVAIDLFVDGDCKFNVSCSNIHENLRRMGENIQKGIWVQMSLRMRI